MQVCTNHSRMLRVRIRFIADVIIFTAPFRLSYITKIKISFYNKRKHYSKIEMKYSPVVTDQKMV